jgi:hypothetical protein
MSLGDSEIDQLFKIFNIRGTPTERLWPGVSSLPDWKAHFPQWAKQELETLTPQLDSDGVQLLDVRIQRYS